MKDKRLSVVENGKGECLDEFLDLNPNVMENIRRSFKEKKTFSQRRAESQCIRTRFPAKIPVIVERYEKETLLPKLDKTKFLVPVELTISQFLQIIRDRMQLHSSQTIYLIMESKKSPGMSVTVGEIYDQEKDDDGFLYFSYASQEYFG